MKNSCYNNGKSTNLSLLIGICYNILRLSQFFNPFLDLTESNPKLPNTQRPLMCWFNSVIFYTNRYKFWNRWIKVTFLFVIYVHCVFFCLLFRYASSATAISYHLQNVYVGSFLWMLVARNMLTLLNLIIVFLEIFV